MISAPVFDLSIGPLPRQEIPAPRFDLQRPQGSSAAALGGHEIKDDLLARIQLFQRIPFFNDPNPGLRRLPENSLGAQHAAESFSLPEHVGHLLHRGVHFRRGLLLRGLNPAGLPEVRPRPKAPLASPRKPRGAVLGPCGRRSGRRATARLTVSSRRARFEGPSCGRDRERSTVRDEVEVDLVSRPQDVGHADLFRHRLEPAIPGRRGNPQIHQ